MMHARGVQAALTVGWLALLLTGCSSAPAPSAPTPPTATVDIGATVAVAPGNPFPAPSSYRAVCKVLASTCNPITAPAGGLPPAIARPLKLPSVTPGAPCPTSDGVRFDTPGFGGMALGDGEPVRPLGSFTSRGVATLVSPSTDGRWLGPKTLWFVDPSYQGPVLIRGGRIDGPGQLAFGEQPELAALIIPPGPTVNGSVSGFRTSPGGTWVTGTGCYAWQIDGATFDYVLVFQVAPHA